MLARLRLMAGKLPPVRTKANALARRSMGVTPGAVKRLCPVVAVAAVLALLAPGLARAATVHVAPGIDRGLPFPYGTNSDDDVAYYDADLGQRNRLLVSFGLHGAGYADATFHDPAALIHAGHGCTSPAAHTARRSSASHIAPAEPYLPDS